jgi:LPS export ABC transporter protein LptC
MRLKPLLVTGLIALITFWWAQPAHRDSQRRTGGSAAPGYYFEDATLDETDEQGKTTLRLHTRRAVEDTPNHAIALTDLSATYLAAPDSIWHLQANSGTMPLGGDVLTLHGQVELRAEAPRAAGAVIVSDSLLLDRNRRIASTAEAARIDWPPHQLHSQGMRLDLIHKTLTLESSVHGTFRR